MEQLRFVLARKNHELKQQFHACILHFEHVLQGYVSITSLGMIDNTCANLCCLLWVNAVIKKDNRTVPLDKVHLPD